MVLHPKFHDSPRAIIEPAIRCLPQLRREAQEWPDSGYDD